MTCHDCGGAIPAGEQWEKGPWWPGVFACGGCAETWARRIWWVGKMLEAGCIIVPVEEFR